jgi:hypothetical protein
LIGISMALTFHKGGWRFRCHWFVPSGAFRAEKDESHADFLKISKLLMPFTRSEKRPPTFGGTHAL